MMLFDKELRIFKLDSFWHHTQGSSVPVNLTESSPVRRRTGAVALKGTSFFHYTCCSYSDFFDDLKKGVVVGLLSLMCFLSERGQLSAQREALISQSVCAGDKENESRFQCYVLHVSSNGT